MVFVLDQRKRPLMPCSERRARLLLSRKRAVVHRLRPFTLRLKDRSREASAVQPTVLKVDPGSKTTGIALARVEVTAEGEVHHALHLAELIHRGEKRIGGFSTGDLVRAEVPGHLKTGGGHLGRIAVRASGSFRIGKIDGINAKYCRVVQRLDGYDYAFH